MRQSLFGEIAKPLLGLAIAMIVLLIVCWFVWGLVCTMRHFRYSLVVTDSRVVARGGKQTLEAPLSELVNVFVAQSWLGKLFRYGTRTVQAKRGSVTVKNVTKPQDIKTLLMIYVQE